MTPDQFQKVNPGRYPALCFRTEWTRVLSEFVSTRASEACIVIGRYSKPKCWVLALCKPWSMSAITIIVLRFWDSLKKRVSEGLGRLWRVNRSKNMPFKMLPLYLVTNTLSVHGSHRGHTPCPHEIGEAVISRGEDMVLRKE